MIKIERPTLIVDEKKVRSNIKRLADKVQRNSVQFRPHFKTHQSLEIGEWFKDYGVTKISVSSVEMAEYFSQRWDDITLAIPVNLCQIDKINTLAERITLNLVIDSFESALFLDQELTHPVNVWIEIDCGYPRTGISWQSKELIGEIAEFVGTGELLNFIGLIAHFGNTYNANSTSMVKRVFSESVSRLNSVKDHLFKIGILNTSISVGDTPSCSLITDFYGVDEIRPGNFVFYDLTQENLGSCQENDIAIAIAAPIIAKFSSRQQIVIYGGSVHLSKEFLIFENDTKIYGKIALPNENGWSKTIYNANIINLSQEHGVITVDRNLVDEIQIGDTLFILPVHSCITANLYKHYMTLEGKRLLNIHSCERPLYI